MKERSGPIWCGLFVLVIVIAMVIQQLRIMEYKTAVEAELVSLNEQLGDITERLEAAEQTIAKMEASSIEGLVEEANGALIDGWQALINTVDEELKRVRGAIQSNRDNQASPSTP